MFYNCRRVTELYTDYLEGRLGRIASIRVRFHLTACPMCRGYEHQMTDLRQELREIEPPKAPSVEASALEHFRRTRPPPK